MIQSKEWKEITEPDQKLISYCNNMGLDYFPDLFRIVKSISRNSPHVKVLFRKDPREDGSEPEPGVHPQWPYWSVRLDLQALSIRTICLVAEKVMKVYGYGRFGINLDEYLNYQKAGTEEELYRLKNEGLDYIYFG